MKKGFYASEDGEDGSFWIYYWDGLKLEYFDDYTNDFQRSNFVSIQELFENDNSNGL